MSARVSCDCGWAAKAPTRGEAQRLAAAHSCPPRPLPDIRASDAVLLAALVNGTRWTTACDLAGLPCQGRETATRLGLHVDPSNGAVRNLPAVVGRILRVVALHQEDTA